MIEFEDVVNDEDVEEFLEEYNTIKERVEEILRMYPVARERGIGTIASIFLYYWHYHPEQMVRLAKAIYILAKKRRRIVVVEDRKNKTEVEKRIVPLKLRGDDLEIFLSAIEGLTNPEDILRNRRRVQNDEGKYRPPDEDGARRKEELVRRAMARWSD